MTHKGRIESKRDGEIQRITNLTSEALYRATNDTHVLKGYSTQNNIK